MTESMKFGPEWLRALSAQQPARYQLAEFRYGREEMLALFSANLPPPESLKQLHGLYVEKAQPPLALNTMSDEETRMWNRGINSDAVLRSVGKGGDRGGGLRGTGGAGGGRGGRGRGAFYRGGGERYEEGSEPPFPRQRFDRSQSERGRDSWSERNGGEGRGGGREPNWRRGQRNSGGGDDEDWRPYKWSVTGRNNNWRDEDNYDGNQTHSSSKGGNQHLPEWVTEKNSEGGGTFDASGAFHGASEHPDEEEPPKRNHENKISSREKEKGSITRNDRMEKGGREDKKLDPESQETPQKTKPPEKDEFLDRNSVQDRTPSPTDSPKMHNPNTQPLSPIHNQRQTPQESVLSQNSRVKSPTPPPATVSPSPSPVERKSPAHQSPQRVVQSRLSLAQEESSPGRQPPNQLQPTQLVPPQPPEPQEDILSNMTDDLAADLVAKLMEDEEKQDKQWYYRDPQGQVQGPFTCNEMAEWFQSGYFTLNLLVRRACDPNYAPLGELIKLWGCIPFLPELHPLNKECAAVLSNQLQDRYVLHHYPNQMRNFFYSPQQPRPQPQAPQAPKLQHDWLDSHQAGLVDSVLPPQYQHPQVGVGSMQQHTNTNTHLRALLATLQQQAKTEPAQTPPVMDTLMSLAHHQQNTVQTPIQALLRHMQQQSTKLHQQQQQQQQQLHSSSSGMDSVWNGGNWNQWGGHVNTKGIKTEQQVLEEQLRAEYLRKEILKAKEDEAKGKEEEEKAKKEREKQQEAAKREEENLARRRAEEEEIRKKQEASRRAEVERQKKGEEKRRKEEEKRKKEEEKRKKDEENRERERLKEEDRKKKEAEEAKKRAQAADVMAKVQRSQWCPPVASNTSIRDIQRSEREKQQILRGLQQQAAAQQQLEQQQQQNIGSKSGLQLKWTEQSSRPQQVESLVDIQAEQQRQFFKQLEKDKEREKEKAAAAVAANTGQNLGSWNQGLAWGSSAWQSSGGLNPIIQSSKSGFWEYEKTNSSVVGGGSSVRLGQQPDPPKSVQNKTKREELAVMNLFKPPEEDDFSLWCTRQLTALQANVEIPTFTTFLREIESPNEISEYVRMYIGDSKEAADFARQFIERRAATYRTNSSSGLLSASQDDRDFTQVKGKSKKTKKGRMQKVDNRMLGFSTTAAPDRINVGDREYPE